MSAYDLVKWSVPLGMATTIFGGSAWLTTTHNMVVENTRELRELEQSYKELNAQSNELGTRLIRIEEKLDYLVKTMEINRERHTHERRN